MGVVKLNWKINPGRLLRRDIVRIQQAPVIRVMSGDNCNDYLASCCNCCGGSGGGCDCCIDPCPDNICFTVIGASCSDLNASYSLGKICPESGSARWESSTFSVVGLTNNPHYWVSQCSNPTPTTVFINVVLFDSLNNDLIGYSYFGAWSGGSIILNQYKDITFCSPPFTITVSVC